MRVLLTTALIIWPSFALAQIGNRSTQNDDLVSNSRLGKLAKKISSENAQTGHQRPSEVQIPGPLQGQSRLQTNQPATEILNENTQSGNQLPNPEQIEWMMALGQDGLLNSQLAKQIADEKSQTGHQLPTQEQVDRLMAFWRGRFSEEQIREMLQNRQNPLQRAKLAKQIAKENARTGYQIPREEQMRRLLQGETILENSQVSPSD